MKTSAATMLMAAAAQDVRTNCSKVGPIVERSPYPMA